MIGKPVRLYLTLSGEADNAKLHSILLKAGKQCFDVDANVIGLESDAHHVKVHLPVIGADGRKVLVSTTSVPLLFKVVTKRATDGVIGIWQRTVYHEKAIKSGKVSYIMLIPSCVELEFLPESVWNAMLLREVAIADDGLLKGFRAFSFEIGESIYYNLDVHAPSVGMRFGNCQSIRPLVFAQVVDLAKYEAAKLKTTPYLVAVTPVLSSKPVCGGSCSERDNVVLTGNSCLGPKTEEASRQLELFEEATDNAFDVVKAELDEGSGDVIS